MDNKEVRKQNRLEQLGTNHPVCVACGEDDWRCLEDHHIAGRKFDHECATLCRNCHRKVSDDQKGHPKKLAKESIKTESIGHFLLGLADLFALLVIKLRAFGHELIQAARRP